MRKLQAAEKKKTPYERRLASSLRVFERYQTPEGADALVSGLLQEAQLRARIATLQQLRRLGARTFAAGEAIQVQPVVEPSARAGLWPLVQLSACFVLFLCLCAGIPHSGYSDAVFMN